MVRVQDSNDFMDTKNLIASAIVFSGVLIAGAILFSGKGQNAADILGSKESGGTDTNIAIRPVGADEHIMGENDAILTIVEFSDFECPFCRQFHPTMERMVKDSAGKVRWVYRHFPLSQHKEAFPAAIASECASVLGGNEAFWNFSKALFDNQSGLGQEFYLTVAQGLSISPDDFKSCLDSQEARLAVEEDLAEVTKAGASGTPFSVILTAGGEQIPFSGVLPYETLKSVVEGVLKLD